MEKYFIHTRKRAGNDIEHLGDIAPVDLAPLKDCLYRRKSVRKYQNKAVEPEIIDKIINFVKQVKCLHPSIKFAVEVIDKRDYKAPFTWLPQQAIAFFSTVRTGYLENAGFIMQQIELYIQSLGLGACYLGIGKPDLHIRDHALKQGDMEYVIMLAFGYPQGEQFRQEKDFNRKPMVKISDAYDEKLFPARFAPSSINSQPWYFTHVGANVHMFCVWHGVLKVLSLTDLNHIDCGIALANLYISNPTRFTFTKKKPAPERENYVYIGTIKF